MNREPLLRVGLPPTPSSLRASGYACDAGSDRSAPFRSSAPHICCPTPRSGTRTSSGSRERSSAEAARPHIDRIASAWLIKRFIESEAQFLFTPPEQFPNDAIPFDAPGVELSHQGEDCTFETLIKRARLRDRRLVRLAEIVHEADLRDGKYPHEEARGIDVAIRALLAASADDHQVLAQGMTLCEGLYVTTSRRG